MKMGEISQPGDSEGVDPKRQPPERPRVHRITITPGLVSRISEEGTESPRDQLRSWVLTPAEQHLRKPPETEDPADSPDLVFPVIIVQDGEKLREKVAEATADYFAQAIGDRIFKATIERMKSEPLPEIVPLEAVEKENDLLQNSVNSPLEALDIALGLSPGEAAVGTGITTNLILAPITGPLEKAETYIEVCGIIVGILTGGHGLVVAFAKPFLHSQLNHALSRLAVNLLLGPQTGANRMEQDRAARTGESPNDDDPLWLCIVFKSEQPSESTLEQPDSSAPIQLEDSDSPDMNTVATPIEDDIPKPTILPVGDYDFVRTLLTVLQDSDVSETDVQTAQAMRDLPAGLHFILRMEGVSFGSPRSSSNSQVGIVWQHPGCMTGLCMPLGSAPCTCSCEVCQRGTR